MTFNNALLQLAGFHYASHHLSRQAVQFLSIDVIHVLVAAEKASGLDAICEAVDPGPGEGVRVTTDQATEKQSVLRYDLEN